VKILFSAGLDGEWKSGWQRCQCLKELGHEIVSFDQDVYFRRASCSRSVRLFTGRFYDQRIVEEFNRDILAALLQAKPDFAWLEWPMLLDRDTIAQAAARLPQCKWISFQDDNPFGSRPGERKRWEMFLDAVPQYDLHFVKRQADVAELQRRGAKSTRIFRHGFYEHLFRPALYDEVERGLQRDVSFVGSPLDHRTAIISDLLSRYDVPLHVYGNRWQRTLVYHRRRRNFSPAVLGRDYVRVICGSRICLGFVSSSNRDEYTMRTFEIPACKGFFLAERTPAHQELFAEGKEAEFFGSAEECAEKVRFYLRNEQARQSIAENGYRRCLRDDYSLNRRMREAVQDILSLDA
jgi:hypothetical protein